jgi:hypothetical protein
MPGGAAVFCAAFFNWLAKTGELSGLSCQVRVKCDVLLSGSPAGTLPLFCSALCFN